MSKDFGDGLHRVSREERDAMLDADQGHCQSEYSSWLSEEDRAILDGSAELSRKRRIAEAKQLRRESIRLGIAWAMVPVVWGSIGVTLYHLNEWLDVPADVRHSVAVLAVAWWIHHVVTHWNRSK